MGFGQSTALELAFTVGLVAVTLIVAGLYQLGVLGMQTSPRWGRPREELAARFAHSLVPIGLAYVVAHYFSLLAYEGQRIAYLVSDPLGDGLEPLRHEQRDRRLHVDLGDLDLVRAGRRAGDRPCRRPRTGP